MQAKERCDRLDEEVLGSEIGVLWWKGFEEVGNTGLRVDNT